MKAESFLARSLTCQEPKTEDGLLGTISQVRDSQVTILLPVHLTEISLILDNSPKFDLLQNPNHIQIKFQNYEKFN